MILSTAFVFSLLVSTWGKTASWVIHEKRDLPKGFVNSGPPPGDHVLNLHIGLTQGNINGLKKALEAASNPSSSNFREWLSSDQVSEYTKPTDAMMSAVTGWLSDHDLSFSHATPAGDWISVKVPVEKASAMFNAQFSTYTHVSSGVESVRTLAYSIPVSLQDAIRTVHPLSSFSAPVTHGPFPTITPLETLVIEADNSQPRCNASAITPQCIQGLYKIPLRPATSKDNSLGVAGFGNEFSNQADLRLFLEKYRPDMPSNTSFEVISVDDGQNSQDVAGAEANFDIQYTVGLATNVQTRFISVGNNTHDGDDDGLLDMVTNLIADPSPPQVLTSSYGFDTESTLSLSVTLALCNAFMQLSARGVSILFATGDSGVASNPGVECDGEAFPPSFPTCPYVTMVGATEGVPERGANLSAGGFSNYFETPSWQKDAVTGYLDFLGPTYSGKFNRSGRAYPDVSAQGLHVAFAINGTFSTFSGTSCSSPIFASIIALINDELIATGKHALGFLNPWLYQHPEAFNDIITGNNPGCSTPGFSATKGWDPVTGLGTPNYTALRTAAGLN